MPHVDWVPDGRDFSQIIAAQRRARTLHNGQPTAIVYRTQKGWGYGIEGRLSHGAGHALCAEGRKRCAGGADAVLLEDCFWQALSVIRAKLEESAPVVSMLSSRLAAARDRLNRRNRTPRQNAPNAQAVSETAARGRRAAPKEFTLAPGTAMSLRAELGRTLRHLNGESGGARLLALGCICEDGIVAALSGISAFGHAMGVASSYAAFLAPLGHIASRLHAIGSQARRATTGRLPTPIDLVCAHSGLKTGEDGPTHADPQSLQLLQENFPRGR